MKWLLEKAVAIFGIIRRHKIVVSVIAIWPIAIALISLPDTIKKVQALGPYFERFLQPPLYELVLTCVVIFFLYMSVRRSRLDLLKETQARSKAARPLYLIEARRVHLEEIHRFEEEISLCEAQTARAQEYLDGWREDKEMNSRGHTNVFNQAFDFRTASSSYALFSFDPAPSLGALPMPIVEHFTLDGPHYGLRYKVKDNEVFLEEGRRIIAAKKRVDAAMRERAAIERRKLKEYDRKIAEALHLTPFTNIDDSILKNDIEDIRRAYA
jgi:hypothetical protein